MNNLKRALIKVLAIKTTLNKIVYKIKLILKEFWVVNIFWIKIKKELKILDLITKILILI